jgi:hypothetical protein
LRNPIISKHGYLVYIVKLPVVEAVEACPQISHEDLGALEDPDGLAALEPHFVPEALKIIGQDVDQSRCRLVCRFYAVQEAAIIFLENEVSAITIVSYGSVIPRRALALPPGDTPAAPSTWASPRL